MTKLLMLDGISGVPLGLELAESFRAQGVRVLHFDCLKQKPRPLYGLRSACAKLSNKRAQKDRFYALPRLDQAALSALVRQENPTHILVIGFIYKFFAPHELKKIATHASARLLLYDTDSCNIYAKRREFVFFIERELPIYDEIFSFSQVSADFFRQTRQLNASYLPFAALPVVCPAFTEPAIDVLFVGSGDLRRILLLEKIKEHVAIFGNRWQRNFALISPDLQSRISDTPVWGQELHALFARAKIILNITRSDFFGAGTGINLRVFEATAAGAFLLTDYCDELDELFVVGEEIETFRSAAELAEKVDYYLQHEDQRRAIAQRGQQRFLAEHTWAARTVRLIRPNESSAR